MRGKGIEVGVVVAEGLALAIVDEELRKSPEKPYSISIFTDRGARTVLHNAIYFNHYITALYPSLTLPFGLSPT